MFRVLGFFLVYFLLLLSLLLFFYYLGFFLGGRGCLGFYHFLFFCMWILYKSKSKLKQIYFECHWYLFLCSVWKLKLSSVLILFHLKLFIANVYIFKIKEFASDASRGSVIWNSTVIHSMPTISITQRGSTLLCYMHTRCFINGSRNFIYT